MCATFCPTFQRGHPGRLFCSTVKTRLLCCKPVVVRSTDPKNEVIIMLPTSSYEIPCPQISTSSQQKWRNAAAFAAWPSVCGGQPKHAPKLPHPSLPIVPSRAMNEDDTTAVADGAPSSKLRAQRNRDQLA